MKNCIFKRLLLPAVMVTQVFSTTCFAHGMTEVEKQAILEGGNLSYIQIGALHMLTGYDHLLFVFGVVFLLFTIRDIIKYVSAFTIGHSITLILATVFSIRLNYYLIDAVIGLSVTYIAFANINGFRKYLDINPPNMLAMILGLGLIHGFGLSSRLQELPLSADGLLLNIISFNIGIELGQLFALLFMVLAIDVFRKTASFRQFSHITNHVLIIAGGLLFLMQMHGYAHSIQPDTSLSAAVTPVATGQPSSEQTRWDDEISIDIPARDDIEYKFHLEKGSSFEFAWETDTELEYDFHGEPDGSITSFASYKQGSGSADTGSLTAPFTGIHGWYWQNLSDSPVTVTLKAKGEYQRMDK